MFTRLEVEGGFLHGLDLRLNPGLNVLIGARGTGKTSVIELIRYVLGAPAYSQAVERRATDHARSILEGGEVRLTFRNADGREHRVIRGADDDTPRRPETVRERSAIVLAQNEIERVGLDRIGRLQLLDGFVAGLPSIRSREERLLSEIASVTSRISDVIAALRAVEEQLARASEVEEQLEAARQSVDHAPADQEISRLQEALQTLDETAANSRERQRLLERVLDNVLNWAAAIEATRDAAPSAAIWPDAQAVGLTFDNTSAAIGQAQDHLRRAQAIVERSASRLSAGIEQAREKWDAAEERARSLRAQLEQRREGAGRHAQLLSRIVQTKSELESAKTVREAHQSEAAALQRERSRLLDELATVRAERYDARSDAASRLNARLGPIVHVEVGRLGMYEAYAGAIATTLRGSGVQYTKLASDLAERMSPQELCDAVESGDSHIVASYSGITTERAGRVIDALREAGTSDIITAPLEDSVDLFLLDGPDYKRTDELSTGQRCTIVLPILLCHSDLTILIDQPEDHLDNAFIVDTVVTTLRERSPDAQFIFATHNANIPVLGEADSITLLASDGRHGFVRTTGPLDSSQSREAVTQVMEGGRAAFERRAAFYGRED